MLLTPSITCYLWFILGYIYPCSLDQKRSSSHPTDLCCPDWRLLKLSSCPFHPFHADDSSMSVHTSSGGCTIEFVQALCSISLVTEPKHMPVPSYQEGTASFMMSSMPRSTMRATVYPCAPHCAPTYKVHSDHGAAQALPGCANSKGLSWWCLFLKTVTIHFCSSVVIFTCVVYSQEDGGSLIIIHIPLCRNSILPMVCKPLCFYHVPCSTNTGYKWSSNNCCIHSVIKACLVSFFHALSINTFTILLQLFYAVPWVTTEFPLTVHRFLITTANQHRWWACHNSRAKTASASRTAEKDRTTTTRASLCVVLQKLGYIQNSQCQVNAGNQVSACLRANSIGAFT